MRGANRRPGGLREPLAAGMILIGAQHHRLIRRIQIATQCQRIVSRDRDRPGAVNIRKQMDVRPQQRHCPTTAERPANGQVASGIEQQVPCQVDRPGKLYLRVARGADR